MVVDARHHMFGWLGCKKSNQFHVTASKDAALNSKVAKFQTQHKTIAVFYRAVMDL